LLIGKSNKPPSTDTSCVLSKAGSKSYRKIAVASKVVTPAGTFWWRDKNKKRIFNKNFARKIKRSFNIKIFGILKITNLKNITLLKDLKE